MTSPNFTLEDEHSLPVFGFDEVGRGPLAGPVVAACVHIPPETRTLGFVTRIRDSKKLAPIERETLAAIIAQHFVCGIAECSPAEIDSMNILQASLEAMRRAFQKVLPPNGGRLGEGETNKIIALIDGNKCPNLPCPAIPVIKGDSKSVSIAAASIIAKVHRDKIMKTLSVEYPGYGWDRNAGYPTQEHITAIRAHGITPHHRHAFAPVREYLEFQTSSIQEVRRKI